MLMSPLGFASAAEASSALPIKAPPIASARAPGLPKLNRSWRKSGDCSKSTAPAGELPSSVKKTVMYTRRFNVSSSRRLSWKCLSIPKRRRGASSTARCDRLLVEAEKLRREHGRLRDASVRQQHGRSDRVLDRLCAQF